MARRLFFWTICVWVLAGVAAQADLVLNDFSPASPPFENHTVYFSLTQNSDGNQTFRGDEGSLINYDSILPAPVDVTGGGLYKALEITAKREPDHQRTGYFFLELVNSPSGYRMSCVADWQDFDVGSFSKVVIPFEAFYQGRDFFGNPTPVDFSHIQRLWIGDGVGGNRAKVDFTFDQIAVVSIPEPSIVAFFAIGMVSVRLVHRRGQMV